VTPDEEPTTSAGVVEEAVPAVGRIDDAVDRAFDRLLRGRPAIDRVMYTVTELADFSLLWHLISSARVVQDERHLPSSLRLSAVLGVESAIVNGILKSVVKRERPVPEFERPHHLRMPLTSSFPSGHASSAFCAAGLLAERSRFPAGWYALATVVAASRVHVKIHHATDVLAGAAFGTALATVAKRVWRVPDRRGRNIRLRARR
jgi:undecaprenyl-diphosphatase